MFLKLLAILFTMVFTENYVLVQFLAICPFLGVSKNLKSSVGMSGAVIFVMTIASAVTWVVYRYLMVPMPRARVRAAVALPRHQQACCGGV